MKKLYILLITFCTIVNAQEFNKSTDKDTSKLENKVNLGIDFGISLGYNFVTENLYEARISPIDNRLLVSDATKTSFLLSTAIAVPLFSIGGKYYTKTINTKTTEGKDDKLVTGYRLPYGIYLVGTVNLASFNGASEGTVFNKKIDGGLGIGYRFNEDFLIAGTFEMVSVSQPRDFLINSYKGQVINVNGQTLTSLQQDNGDFFHDKYCPSFSIKIVYLLRKTNLPSE